MTLLLAAPIATRVNASLYFFFTDHLGSMAVLATSVSTLVAGSRATYLPFGAYRGAAPTQTVTDRDFTGQPQNRAVGLLYYQARWYVPGIGRFASADSIVPDPTNPQQFNKYAYSLNNPIRYSDPTGHCIFAFPFDFLGCVIVGLTLAIDYSVNHRPALQRNPAEIDGPPNLVAVTVNTSIGMFIGGEREK